MTSILRCMAACMLLTPASTTSFAPSCEKLAGAIRPGKDPAVPYFVSADGQQARFNTEGMDIERAFLFVLNVCHTWEVTGDSAFARELLPACHACLDWGRRRDLDGDHLPEGRCLKPARCTGVGPCGGCAYIGDTARNDWKDFGVALFFWEALRGVAEMEKRVGNATTADQLLAEANARSRHQPSACSGIRTPEVTSPGLTRTANATPTGSPAITCTRSAAGSPRPTSAAPS